MKATTILISCAFLGGAAFAQAGEEKKKGLGDGTLPEFLVPYDENNDGILDEEEIQAMKELRKLAREERRDEIDTDGDGVISEEELEAAREAMRAEIAAKRAEKFNIIAASITDDGVIDADEFAAIAALEDLDDERVAAMFDRLDANDDGEVTLDEFNARLRHHRRHRHGPGGDGPGGDGPGGDGPGGDGPGGDGPGGDGPGGDGPGGA